MTTQERIQQVIQDWENNPRWKNVVRPYTAEEVVKLSGSYKIDYSIARMGAERLWNLLHSEHFVAESYRDWETDRKSVV